MRTLLRATKTTGLGPSITKVGTKLLPHVNASSVISPLNIDDAMSIIRLGAVNQTEKELAAFLEFRALPDNLAMIHHLFNQDIVKLANCLLVNNIAPLRDTFLAQVNGLALISNEDFSDPETVVNKANSFIAEKTNGLITNVLSTATVDQRTMMILIATIYFKAQWKNAFKIKRTRMLPFNGNDAIQVPMMSGTFECFYGCDDVVQMIELPYTDENFTMGFILPRSKEASMDVCYPYIGSVDLRETDVCVSIPKFTQRTKLDLVEILKKEGVRDLFTSECKLDGMFEDSRNIYVSQILHEAVVIVDEEGTEAAAVTAVVFSRESCRQPSKPITFTADRSFIFYIKHKPTDIIMFVGEFNGN